MWTLFSARLGGQHVVKSSIMVKSSGHIGKSAFLIPLVMLALPSWTNALDCPALNKELGRLRLHYHKQAQEAGSGTGAVSFDELTAILDRIVDLKNSMRRLNCDIPPRHKNLQTGR
jgi:hypothetical protein